MSVYVDRLENLGEGEYIVEFYRRMNKANKIKVYYIRDDMFLGKYISYPNTYKGLLYDLLGVWCWISIGHSDIPYTCPTR